MKKIIILTILFFSLNCLYSQTDKENQTIEDLIEDISANSDEELDYSTLYDDLSFFLTQPLDLNAATKEDLEKLQFLNELQIQNILNYILKNGKMLTIYELQLIDGFEKEDILRVLPFVTVDAKREQAKLDLKKAMKYGQNEVFLRTQFVTQQQSGYIPIPDSILVDNPNKNRYLGNKYKYYVKYKYHYKNMLQWGFTMEKDPGEEFFKGTQKQGFDYYSAHLQIDNYKFVKRLVVGDYQVQFGQGLVLWPGMSSGKSSYPLNIKKKPQGIKKYSSADENLFMRGAGTIVKLGKFEVAGFYSTKKIDANITATDTIGDIEMVEISSLEITGYHTTPNEIADKHAIRETVFGGNLTYRGNKFKTGITMVGYNFGADLNKDIKPYNQFEFSGSQNFNASFDYHFTVQDINIFGEAAVSQNGATAYLNGALIPLHPQISLAVVQRYYDKEYQAYYGGAFSEGGKVENEQGFYIGTEIYPYKRWKISAYFDTYTFPWLKSRQNAPSTGFDYFVETDYNPNRHISMYIKFKREIKAENSSFDDVQIQYLEDVDKISLRYNISFELTDWLTLKNRVEYASYQKGNLLETGYMLYQDIKFVPAKIPLTLYFRYGIFDAPYNARMYAYENDILYAFSIPGYYYKGFRTYLTLNYDITNKITIWLRYGQFSYSDRDVISAGALTEIQGNTKSEIKAQLRIKL